MNDFDTESIEQTDFTKLLIDLKLLNSRAHLGNYHFQLLLKYFIDSSKNCS